MYTCAQSLICLQTNILYQRSCQNFLFRYDVISLQSPPEELFLCPVILRKSKYDIKIKIRLTTYRKDNWSAVLLEKCRKILVLSYKWQNRIQKRLNLNEANAKPKNLIFYRSMLLYSYLFCLRAINLNFLNCL